MHCYWRKLQWITVGLVSTPPPLPSEIAHTSRHPTDHRDNNDRSRVSCVYVTEYFTGPRVYSYFYRYYYFISFLHNLSCEYSPRTPAGVDAGWRPAVAYPSTSDMA